MNAQAPLLPLLSLDAVWFQVAGTLCNLKCHHCFISCSPTNRNFGFLSLEKVKSTLQEAVKLGVREFYFTGGEPFLNKELVPMLEQTLEVGPATVLTNGTVLKPEWLKRLRDAARNSIYSLEFRVSIDGSDPETNDPIRGEGTFERALKGVKLLCEYGFLPIITIAQTWEDDQTDDVLDRFRDVLRAAGNNRPRLKVLPRLKLGAEANRTCGYESYEAVTSEMLEDYDVDQLLCSRSRIVTDRGIAVCPILIDSPDAVLGQTFEEASRPFALSHGACSTCYQYGSICANASSKSRVDR